MRKNIWRCRGCRIGIEEIKTLRVNTTCWFLILKKGAFYPFFLFLIFYNQTLAIDLESCISVKNQSIHQEIISLRLVKANEKLFAVNQADQKSIHWIWLKNYHTVLDLLSTNDETAYQNLDLESEDLLEKIRQKSLNK